jgi:hypothetical protein
MIKEYMEIGVKNDDALIKMAAIIQRIESAQAKGDGDSFFDPSELAALLEDTEDTQNKLGEGSKDETEE